jgi:hypothetical protein
VGAISRYNREESVGKDSIHLKNYCLFIDGIVLANTQGVDPEEALPQGLDELDSILYCPWNPIVIQLATTRA